MTFLHGTAVRLLLAAAALLLMLAGGALLHSHLLAADDDAAGEEIIVGATPSSSPCPTPAPLLLCNHTIQGKTAVVDDSGRLCNRSALDAHGCCATDELDVARCNASGAPCYEEYELCVCCCIRVALLNFEWCSARCRTSGATPQRHCYKTEIRSASQRPTSSPRPTSDYFEWKRR